MGVGLCGTYSTPTKPSNSFLSRSLNHSLSGSTRKTHPSKTASGNLGLPVPTSDTTPSPFAVVPHNLKSSTSGFPINRPSLQIWLDEQTGFSSDEGGKEDEQPDSGEEQWPTKRCDPGAPKKAFQRTSPLTRRRSSTSLGTARAPINLPTIDPECDRPSTTLRRHSRPHTRPAQREQRTTTQTTDE
ncbi:hypothetical protein PGTUg99_032162 [Puccinia graminis f. sp. tritici]|uniref:Uncharacterized protein n=1 Tax=Puccinia graminis f. sp. tritici TaxID=56615 RepID=A0A5B0LW50_PUCGR|nr:hypothetical protein PGTUg99_032162 [Puccinia graminis f. sp. tritici]